MKKWVVLILSISALFTLTACDYVPTQRETCDVACQVNQLYGEGLNPENLVQVRDAIRESSLYIEVEHFRSGFRGSLQRVGTTSGSGFVIHQEDSTVYALTNHHVLDGGENIVQSDIRVELLNGTSYEATLLAYDVLGDMALIRFEALDQSIHVMDIYAREHSPLMLNEFLLSLGNPQGVKHMVTFGLFLGTSMIQDVDFVVIRHSAINHSGNSGGALTDYQGYLVGMNTWSDPNSDVVNFAIPLENIIEFVESYFNEE